MTIQRQNPAYGLVNQYVTYCVLRNSVCLFFETLFFYQGKISRCFIRYPGRKAKRLKQLVIRKRGVQDETNGQKRLQALSGVSGRLVISVLYIIVGHEIAMTNYQPFNEDDQSVVVTATVQEIKDRYSESYQISETEYAENETILFTAKIRSGEEKGQVVEAAQTLDYFTAINLRAVEPGDKVLLYTIPGGMAENQWLH